MQVEVTVQDIMDNSNYVVDRTGPDLFPKKNDSCYLVAAIGQSRLMVELILNVW